MPIIHSLKTVFIHIPKAGGTSVESCICDFPLFKYKMVNKYNWYGNLKTDDFHYELDHSTMAFMKKNCKYFKNHFYSFTIVRNPYARLVSEYHYCKYQYSRFIKNIDTFRDFVFELKSKFTYVLENKEKNHYLVSHYLPQYIFTHNYKKVQIIKDIFKLENINNDWEIIKKKINIDSDLQKVEKYSSKFKYNYEDYYTEELKDIVYELYKDDFTIFNYHK